MIKNLKGRNSMVLKKQKGKPIDFRNLPAGEENTISKLTPSTRYGKHRGNSIKIWLIFLNGKFNFVKAYDVGIAKSIHISVEILVVFMLSFIENCTSFVKKASFI